MRPTLPALLSSFALAALLSPAEGSAQVIPSPYQFIDTRHEAGLFMGTLSGNRGQLDLGPGGGPLIGGRYGIKLGSAFGFEASGYFVSTDRRVWDPEVEAEEDPILLGATNSLVGGLDARLRFSPMGPRTWRNLAPYAVVGGGVAMDLRRSSTLEEELSENAVFTFGPSLVGSLGAGARWLPGNRFGFRIEAGLHLWKLGTPAAFRTLEAQLGPLPEDEWVGLGALTLGASYRF